MRQERGAIDVMYHAAEVGPAIGAIARLILLCGRAFHLGGGWAVAALVLVLIVVGVAAVSYVRNRMRKGEDAPNPPDLEHGTPRINDDEAHGPGEVSDERGGSAR